ncbi:MAG: hypothetical protein JEZ04_22235 [Spirochaetales bacterium]|nr:hypothetical protein [Spirochaetales bacterium]
MGKIINLEKEIRIVNVKSVWEEILPILQDNYDKSFPQKINMKEVEIIDSAGLQLILFLFSLAEELPEKYIIESLSDKIKQLSQSIGFRISKGEVKK